jgi:2,4-dienoyl-CoA reductase-like NADH-dependent reductase (Old Yellow Enzyme family)
VIDELISVFGAGRVGIKVSPVGRYNDMFSPDPIELYTYLFKEFDKRGLAFIELKDDQDKENSENYGYPGSKDQIPDIFTTFRPFYKGVFIGNNLYTPTTAEENIKAGKFEIVTFGRLYISSILLSNIQDPDLI